MTWVMRRVPSTGRPAGTRAEAPRRAIDRHTKDGRWVWRAHGTARDDVEKLRVELLDRYGLAAGLQPTPPRGGARRRRRGPRVRRADVETRAHAEVVQRFVARMDLCTKHAVARGAGSGPALGAAAQAARERARPALAAARHVRGHRPPGARASFRYPTSKWISTRTRGGRAPRAAAQRGCRRGAVRSLRAGRACPARTRRRARPSRRR